MPACARCGAEIAASTPNAALCADCTAREAQEMRPAVFHRPKIYLTNALILANTLIFLAMLMQGAVYVRVIGPIALPQFTPLQLLVWGANWGPLSLTIQPWRLLMSNYLHGGLIHIASNMFCLWGLGRLTEAFYTKADFILAYTVTGVCGSLLSVLVTPAGVPSVGASGAVFGLAGLMLATLKWGHIPLQGEVRNLMYKEIVKFSLINFAIGFAVPHIDNMGHLGGFLSGVLVGSVLGRRLDGSEPSVRYRRVTWGLMILLLMAAIYGTMRLHWRLLHAAAG